MYCKIHFHFSTFILNSSFFQSNFFFFFVSNELSFSFFTFSYIKKKKKTNKQFPNSYPCTSLLGIIIYHYLLFSKYLCIFNKKKKKPFPPLSNNPNQAINTMQPSFHSFTHSSNHLDIISTLMPTATPSPFPFNPRSTPPKKKQEKNWKIEKLKSWKVEKKKEKRFR